MFRSVSVALAEPAMSVRPAISLSVLASRLSVRACISLTCWFSSSISTALSPVPFLRAAWVAALCWA